MNVFVTVYTTPTWQPFVNITGLSVIENFSAFPKGAWALISSQAISNLPLLVEQSTKIQHLWIATIQAEHFIADALDNGSSLAQAAKTWEQVSKNLLKFQSKHRKKIKLFNLHQALENPASFREHLGNITINDYPAQPREYRLSLLAASQYVTQQPEIKHLNTLLQASTLLLCENESLTLDIDAIFQKSIEINAELLATKEQLQQALDNLQAVKETHENNDSSSRMIDINQDRHLILAQLHQAQEQLEESNNLMIRQVREANEERDLIFLQLQAANEERDQLFSQLQDIKIQLSTNQNLHLAELNVAIAERDLTLSQLHQLQEQLESIRTAHTQQLNEISEEKNRILSQLHQLQQQFDSLNSSSSSQLKDISEDRDNILMQLRQAQQKLEANALLHNRLLNEANEERDLFLSQLHQTQEQYEKTVNDNTKHLRELSEERDIIIAQLHQTQEELERYFLTLKKEQEINQKLQENLNNANELAAQLRLETEKMQTVIEENDNLKRAQKTNEQSYKHSLLARDKQNARDIAKIEGELRKTKARAASAEFAAQLLQQELDKLTQSISWKAATPVRAIGKLIRKPDVNREKLIQEIGLLLTSEYFDVEWYLRTYPDIKESNINPAEHYLLFGAQEGRLPGPFFDGNWYLQHYPDVAAAGLNPLLHFIKYGQQEGRSSSPKLLTSDNADTSE